MFGCLQPPALEAGQREWCAFGDHLHSTIGIHQAEAFGEARNSVAELIARLRAFCLQQCRQGDASIVFKGTRRIGKCERGWPGLTIKNQVEVERCAAGLVSSFAFTTDAGYRQLEAGWSFVALPHTQIRQLQVCEITGVDHNDLAAVGLDLGTQGCPVGVACALQFEPTGQAEFQAELLRTIAVDQSAGGEGLLDQFCKGHAFSLHQWRWCFRLGGGEWCIGNGAHIDQHVGDRGGG